MLCATFLTLLLPIVPTIAQTTLNIERGSNLIQNAGFESGREGWSDAFSKGEVVSDVAHSGEHSFYLKNDDAKSAASFEQALDVQPGQKLYFSIWVKGQDVKGPGAGIKIESFNDSKYSDGFLPVNKTGTFDWTQVTGDFTVPRSATRTIVSLYLQKYLSSGTTGEAWFDDVEVRSIPFEVTAVHPNYRGIVKQGDNSPLDTRIDIYAESQWKKAPVKVQSTLTDAEGKVLFTKNQFIASSRKTFSIRLTLPRDLPVGKYNLEQRIIDPNGKERLVRKEPINVVQKMPRVYIDGQGFTVVDGKRFFPMGLYLGQPTEEDLERISKGGFNTVLSYSWNPKNPNPEEYMDLAEKHHLKVVYSLKDLYPQLDGTRTEAFNWARGIIKRVHDKPALLAWYTNDEFAPSIGWLPKLKEMYNLVKQEDPYQHPAFQAQNKYASLPYEFDITDILAMDLYPVGWPGGDIKLGITSAETRRTAKFMRGVKGVWTVPQIFDWAVYNEGTKQIVPTLDEMRNQSYQAIINGATGLVFYSYFDLWSMDNSRKADKATFDKRWPIVVAMAKEMNAITPIVLQGKRIDLNLPENPQTTIGELQDGNQQLFQMADSSFHPQIEVGAFQDGDQLLLLMANPAYEENSITLKLPKGWKIKDANQGEIKSTFANGKVTFTLPSVGSGVFRLVRK